MRPQTNSIKTKLNIFLLKLLKLLKLLNLPP